MKLALVTTPRSVRSGIGDYTHRLLPYLREHCDVELFVAPEHAPSDTVAGLQPRSIADLRPKEWDRILYQLGNERSHAFMLPAIAAFGGTVALHDWVLFDVATAAFPALERGGVRGHVAALREGGLAAAVAYWRNRRDHRRTRREALVAGEELDPRGALLGGWHAPEPGGRWASPRAGVRIPDGACQRVAIEIGATSGRAIRVTDSGREVACLAGGGGVLEFSPSATRTFVIATDGIEPSRQQRENGDPRELGAFVRSIRWEDDGVWHELDIAGAPALPGRPVELSRERFDLPLNRRAVRRADSYVVHSDWMRLRILEERNAPTPVGIAPHGAERRWRDDDRAGVRARIGLPEGWEDGPLLVSFGAVQEHKRVDRVLAALASARRQRRDLRLVLAGELRTETLDVPGLVRELGLADAVHVTGWLDEDAGWDHLHAADLCVNLRGPSTGGTSGGILQALSLGRGVIASDLEEQRELPESCVLRVSPGADEVEALSALLVELCDDRARRSALEKAARDYVDRQCHWSHAAARYVELLELFPAHRTNRKSLIHTAIEESDRWRDERAKRRAETTE